MANQVVKADGSVFFLVNTTNGTEVGMGEILISANLRETKEKKVTEDQRYRNIVIKEFSFPNIEDKFKGIVAAKFYDLAKARLEAEMEESNRSARELPAEYFSVDGLLSFFAAVAVSQRITGDTVASWFDASATGKYIAGKLNGNAAQLKKYRDLFIKSASPNHGINPNTCKVLLGLLQDEDKESNIYSSLANKWQATITKSQSSEIDML